MRVLSASVVVLGLLLLGATTSARADEASKSKAKAKAKALDLGLPSMGALPNADGLVKPEEEKATLKTDPGASATYEVVSVRHARAFKGSPTGAVPVAPIDAVKLSGTPPTTEKFATVVRVKSSQRASAPIEVVILDPRSDTVMSASGKLSYEGATTDEAEYVIDWEPTPLRSGGEFQVLVRVGGHPLGTWPLRVAPKG